MVQIGYRTAERDSNRGVKGNRISINQIQKWKVPPKVPLLDRSEVGSLVSELDRFVVGALSAFRNSTRPNARFVIPNHWQAVHGAAWDHLWTLREAGRRRGKLRKGGSWLGG